MKFPNHIILDISKPALSQSTQYWIFKYVFSLKQNCIKLSDNLSYHKKFIFKKENLFLNKIMQNQKKYTIRYNFSNPAIFLNNKEKNFYKKVFKSRTKVKHRALESKAIGKEIFDFLADPKKKYNEKILKRLIKNFSYKLVSPVFKSNNLWNLFDINFLRKEKMYTKLKYSRVPQYDIVSGGAAALFAGFLGFLICEKFGFELVDSGDFYFLFMYLVFLFFFCRLFLRIMDGGESSWNIVSLKWLILFYKSLAILLIKLLTSIKKL